MTRRFLRPLAIALLLGSLAAAKNPANLPAKDAKPAPDNTSVILNTNSHKYHCPTCAWAKKCTTNCTTTTLADAKKQGATACKICGGACPAPIDEKNEQD